MEKTGLRHELPRQTSRLKVQDFSDSGFRAQGMRMLGIRAFSLSGLVV